MCSTPLDQPPFRVRFVIDDSSRLTLTRNFSRSRISNVQPMLPGTSAKPRARRSQVIRTAYNLSILHFIMNTDKLLLSMPSSRSPKKCLPLSVLSPFTGIKLFLTTAELEDAATSHPQVAEAAVVSKADPVKGESIVVFVIPTEGGTPSVSLKKELTDHMRRMVGPIATPDEIYFVSKLPKTRSGKIMRRVLRAVASNLPIGDITTLEDEASVEEVIKSYQELKKAEE